MLYEFQVGTAARSCEILLDGLKGRLCWVTQKGVSFKYDRFSTHDPDVEMIHFKLEGNSNDLVFNEADICDVFRLQLAEAIAEHIIVDCEKGLLLKEISRSIKKLPHLDQNVVYKKAYDILHNYRDNESLNLLLRFGRKNRITQKVKEYMKDNQRLLIEGFITFCLQDYLSEIKYAVEVALEELKNQKEYIEFVSLLRHFVDTQVPKMNEANLLVGKSGIFQLWDGNGAKIDEQYIHYYLDEMLLNEISLDDVLVSILITISPRRIIIHNSGELGNTEPVLMIRNVFKERIGECSGCERCQPGKQEQQKSR